MVHSDENIEVVYAAAVVQWEGLGEKEKKFYTLLWLFNLVCMFKFVFQTRFNV